MRWRRRLPHMATSARHTHIPAARWPPRSQQERFAISPPQLAMRDQDVRVQNGDVVLSIYAEGAFFETYEVRKSAPSLHSK